MNYKINIVSAFLNYVLSYRKLNSHKAVKQFMSDEDAQNQIDNFIGESRKIVDKTERL